MGCLFCIPKEASIRTFNNKVLKGRVSRVIDGDTIKVITRLPKEPYYEVSLRLFGLDCPEMKPKGLTKNNHQDTSEEIKLKILERNAANAITIHLKSLLTGKYVKVRYYKEEKYGRCLGILYLREGLFRWKNINNYLIEEGYAVRYTGNAKAGWTEEALTDIIIKLS